MKILRIIELSKRYLLKDIATFFYNYLLYLNDNKSSVYKNSVKVIRLSRYNRQIMIKGHRVRKIDKRRSISRLSVDSVKFHIKNRFIKIMRDNSIPLPKITAATWPRFLD